MEKLKVIKFISLVLLVIGLILLFVYVPVALFSIFLSIILFLGRHYESKRSSNQNTQEHEKIITIIQESSGANRKLESLKNLLKKENIDIQKTISKFDSPIWSIFIFKWGEQPQYSKVKPPKLLLEHLTKKLNFEIIGNSFYFIPPNKMPKIRVNFDIGKWTEKNIISRLPKKIPYNIKWISLVDLRKVFAYKTTNYGETIFDILLKKDKQFLSKFLENIKTKNINFSKISEDWEIADIITLKIDNKILRKIKKNNLKILEEVNCKKIFEIADVETDFFKTKLNEIIEINLDEDLIKNIKDNAKALKEIQ